MLDNDEFVTVLTDTFVSKGESITIDTSVSGLIYRVEVFYDSDLIDAIEVSYNHLRSKSDSDTLFVALYKQAHNEMLEVHHTKNNTCLAPQLKDSEIPQVSDVNISIDEKHINGGIGHHATLSWSRSLYLRIKRGVNRSHINHPILLPTAIIVLVCITLLFSAKVFLCSNYIIETFMDNAQQRVSYLERTEFLCHKLEKQCKVLAKGNKEQTYSVSIKQCKYWCKVDIISENACAVMLPYFPETKSLTNIKEEENITTQVVLSQPKPKSPYRIDPKGKIELFPSSAIELYIANQTKEIMRIATIDLSLDQNSHEEIVQFRKGMSTLSIKAGEEKAFKIFLESTYYTLFEKGKYTGYIDFEISYEKGRKIHIRKAFFFEVK